MIRKDFINKQITELSSIYDRNEAFSILRVLYEFYFNDSFINIYADNDSILLQDDINNLNNYFIRLMKSEPVQYVIGETVFYNRKFKLDSNVLIPRPETEELVQKVIDDYKGNKTDLKILDIGTGSGCIAVTLALELETAKVTAIDVSEKALAIAQDNGTYNRACVVCYHDDIINPTKIIDSKFDIIVSNPPYVMDSEKCQINKNVISYEPHEALFVSDSNPLYYYDAIIKTALRILKHNGSIYLEINHLLKQEMIDKYKPLFNNIEVYKDLNSKYRILKLFN